MNDKKHTGEKAGNPINKPNTGISVKRVYDPVSPDDGYRVLVDRLWPRGISKDNAAIDEWLKDATPSAEIRKSFHADRSQYPEFARLYEKELRDEAKRAALDSLAERAGKTRVTLLTAASDIEHSHIPVLLRALGKR